MQKEHLHLALVQCRLEQENKGHNLAHLEEMLEGLNGSGVQLVILPEMFNTGFGTDAARLAEPLNLHTWKWLQQMAKRLNAVITGSLAVQDEGHYYNRLVFMYPDGAARCYDKRHLFTMAGEDGQFKAGAHRHMFKVFGWRIMPSICYDLRFPVWLRNRIEQPYDLLINVANWPQPRQDAWQALLPARAIENLAFVAGVNRVGHDSINNIDYVGGSGVYDYKGQPISTAGNVEQVIEVVLDRSKLHAFRAKFPALPDADNFRLEL